MVKPGGNNPYGKPVGARCRPGHNVGGYENVRIGRERKKQADELARIRTQERESAKQKNSNENPEKIAAQQQKLKAQRLEKLEQREKEAIAALREMSLGIEEEGVSERNEEDDELDDYMMDDEEVFDNSEKDGDVGIDGSNSNREKDSIDDCEDAVAESRRRYQKRSYMPKKDSPLYKAMEKVKKNVKKTKGLEQNKSITQLWWENGADDPVCCFQNQKEPDDFYAARLYPFVWRPVEQFKGKMLLSDICCINKECRQEGKLNIDKYEWRPMICFDKVTWVLSNRLKCKECKKSFGTTHPHFISQLPTLVAERFPFVCPLRGPGIHQMLIFHFTGLMTKQISFGSYVDSINSLHRIQHSMDTVSYYDCQYWKRKDSILEQGIPTPFSGFFDTAAYNGIKLTINNFKACCMVYLETREPYFQASFQKYYDKGVSTDHTHHFGNTVRCGRTVERTFTAGYGVLSLIGFINIMRLTMTKGTQELQQLLQDYKDAREQAGAPKLKVFTSDCLNADGGIWRSKFPELSEDVVPYKPPTGEYPRLRVDLENIDYIDNVNDMNRIALALSAKYSEYAKEKKVIYGFDAEWNWGETGARLLIIAMPKLSCDTNDNCEKVKLFDLSAAGVFSSQNFPVNLKNFLENKDFVPVGVHVGGDCGRMRRFGVTMTAWYELTGIAKQLYPHMKSYALAQLVELLLKASLDKHGQKGDYSVSPLPDDLKIYAGLDGLVLLPLFNLMLRELKNYQIEPVIQAPKGLGENVLAELHLGGEVVGEVKIQYLGGRDAVETKLWGATKVKNGSALVTLQRVYVGNTKPPYSFRRKAGGGDPASWKRTEMTMNSLFESKQEFMVRTSSLVHLLDGDTENAFDFLRLDDAITNKAIIVEEQGENIGTAINEMPENNEIRINAETPIDDDPFLTFENADFSHLEFGEDEFPRSRLKHDIFHRFQNLPIKKSEPLYHVISRLLIHATFEFDEEDFPKVEAHVGPQLKNSKQADAIAYQDELMDHFYHNREWWRMHCRVYTPNARDHAQKIEAIRNIMEKDPDLNKLLTEEMKSYFDSFILAIQKGEFEELSDVQMYAQIGSDTNGLPLYIRFRGTVRNENVHQKMKNSIGPWKIGARTAHMLLVFLAYRYNVKTNIKRNMGYDFGHCELYLIDRIQKRIQDIYNVLIWPRHINVRESNGLPGFISVGIGPLCYDERFVEKSEEPAPNLKGDLRFVAKQMGLKYPLLHLGSSRDELKLFNDFMISKKPTVANFTQLAEEFRRKANGETIFYKLPSMLKSYYKNWEKNHEIKTSERALRGGARALLRNFFTTTTNSSEMYPSLRLREPTSNQCSGASTADEELNNFRNTLMDVSINGEQSTLGVEVGDNSCEEGMEDTEDNEAAVEEDAATSGVFVPALSAPMQCNYIAPPKIPMRKRKCVAFPHCQRSVDVCRGNNSVYDCLFTRQDFIDDPSLLERNQINKSELKRAETARRVREHRRRKKSRAT